jgi:hypothetical protein
LGRVISVQAMMRLLVVFANTRESKPLKSRNNFLTDENL